MWDVSMICDGAVGRETMGAAESIEEFRTTQ